MATIYTQRSDLLATTWNPAVAICTGESPSHALLMDGVILVGYEDSGTCYLRSSEDSGATWSAAFGSQAGENPFIWRAHGLLYRTYYSSSNVYFQYSGDRGVTWSSPVVAAVVTGEVLPAGLSLADGRPQVGFYDGGARKIYESPNADGSGSWSLV